MAGRIIQGHEYGDPRKQIADLERYGGQGNVPQDVQSVGRGRVVSNKMFQGPDGEMHRKTAQFGYGQGTLAGAGSTFTGASPLAGSGSTPKGSTMTSAPMYYDPRYSTPDKFYFPRTEVQANAIWRHLYETDAAISVATDMFAELPWSEFDLVGVEDKAIRNIFESMMGALNLPSHMEGFTREYLKLGKVIPHLIFDDAKGYFIRLGAFDPDYVRVTPVPFMGEEPILDLRPDPAMRAFMKSTDPRAMFIKSKLPAFLKERILSNQPIPLQNTNTTYVARKTSPYRSIGVSLYTRLFRIQMFEDFLVNASMAIAQRNAAPLRMFILGDPQSGWLPTDTDIQEFSEMLSIVESVEGNHFVPILMGDKLEVLPFDSLWERAVVPVIERGNNKQFKDIRDLNWKTLSLNKDGTQSWELIKHILRHPTPDQVVCLETPQSEIRSTESHGFLWLNPKTAELESVTPKELEQRERPTVVNLRNFDFSVKAKEVFGCSISPDFSYFIGLFTADGALSGPACSHVRVSNSDEGILNWLSLYASSSSLVESFKVYKEANTLPNGGSCKAVVLRMPSLKPELLDFYGFSHKKGGSTKKTGIEKLPNELLYNSEDTVVGALWAGILDGDGSVGRRELTLCYGTSLTLMHQLGLSLLTRGIKSRIAPPGKVTKTYATSLKNTTMPVYRLIISGEENIRLFISLCLPYVRHTKKMVKLQAFLKCIQGKPVRDLFTDVYDFDPELTKGITLPYYSKLHRLSKSIINASPKSSDKVLTAVDRFCSTSVQKISRVAKTCEFVYDLALESEPHNYLVGGLGWCLNHNTDPFGAMIYHTGLQRVDYIGVSDRLMSISREWDFIERVKFLALGVSKAFLVGETSFAAAVAGMQTLLERLQALRMKFESSWIYPKILEPVSRMNKFYKRSKAELDHHIRTSKDDSDLIVPTIKWHKSLEPSQDVSVLQLWNEMNQRGIVSDRTFATGAGVNIDVERTNISEETTHKRELGVQKNPVEREQALTQALGAGVTKVASTYHVASDVIESKIWDRRGYYKEIQYTEVEPIISLLKEKTSADTTWNDVYNTSMDNEDGFSWKVIDNELEMRGFTVAQADAIKEILVQEGVFPKDSYEAIIDSQLDAVEVTLSKDIKEGGKSLLAGE